MRRFPGSVLLGLAVLVLAAGPVRAQDTAERVAYALEATDARIELALRLVAEVPLEPARLDVEAAQDLQLRARTAFAASQYALAMRLTLDARARADHAIALVRGLPDPDRIAAQLERTREILDRARDRMAECRLDRAHALLRTAIDMQHRAERAFDADVPRFLAALQLTTGARERGLRALRLCRIEARDDDSAEHGLMRTDEVIARVREHLARSDHPGAERALARAVELQERARRQFRDEHFEAALQSTRSARAFAHRALRIGDPGARLPRPSRP